MLCSGIVGYDLSVVPLFDDVLRPVNIKFDKVAAAAEADRQRGAVVAMILLVIR